MASAHRSGSEVVTTVAQMLYTPSSLLWGFLRPHDHNEALGSCQGAMGLQSGSGSAAAGFGWPNLRKGTAQGGARAERKGGEPQDRVCLLPW